MNGIISRPIAMIQIIIWTTTKRLVIICHSFSVLNYLGISTSITVPFLMILPESLLLKRNGLTIVARAISGDFPKENASGLANINFAINSCDVNLVV